MAARLGNGLRNRCADVVAGWSLGSGTSKPTVPLAEVVIASVIGVVITLLLLACAFAADLAGHADLARALFWYDFLMQSLIPLGNMGTAEQRMYAGTPLNFLGFLTSIPVGFVIYGVAAYVAIRMLRSRA